MDRFGMAGMATKTETETKTKTNEKGQLKMTTEKTTDLITITPPNGNAEIGREMYALVLRRERELKAEFAAVAEKLTPERFAETKAEWTRLKKIDGELKNIIDALERGAIQYAACDALLVQLNATRKSLKAVYDESWEKFVALRDADKPEPPKHTYLVRMTCTDAVLAKVLKAAQKEGAAEFVWCVPQSDKAVKAAQRIFEENV